MIKAEQLQASLRSQSIEHLSIPTIIRFAAGFEDGSRHVQMFERLKQLLQAKSATPLLS